MNTDISIHLNNLKQVLVALHPSGPEGFEGLIGHALAAIVRIPFRLASSGSQFGVDGTSAYAGPGISFECKRYSNGIPLADVMAKLGELSIREEDVDLWVLCTTSQVGAQLASRLEQFSRSHSISTLILDWPNNSIPPLAILLAMAVEQVPRFLRAHSTSDRVSLERAISALGSIRQDHIFAEHANRLRQSIDEPMLGAEAAKASNAVWLTDTFSSRIKAITRLGQPLSPNDPNDGRLHQRRNLTDPIVPFLSDAPKDPLYIVGKEGTGKSWAIAESWLRTPNKPILIFISPNDFSDNADQINIQTILVPALIRQTDGHATLTLEQRWIRIIESWKRTRQTQVRCIVVVDGVNQRPQKPWSRLLERLSSELTSYGFQLIVTVRTGYFQVHIRDRLLLPYEVVDVDQWTDSERDAILARHGVQQGQLSPSVASALRNPRMLGITLSLWTHQRIASLDGLSVNRLLFEHIRTTSQFESQEPHKIVGIVRRHAEEIASRAVGGVEHDLTVFRDDLAVVAQERFFSLLDDDPTRYRICDEGLPLALGLLLVDRVRYALRNNIDATEEVWRILEPVSTLDMTSDMVLAAITVACVDGTQEDAVGIAVLRVFANMQNPTEMCRHQLDDLARHRVGVFAQSVRDLYEGGGGQPNLDLIESALFFASTDQTTWPTVHEHIQLWLSSYSLFPSSPEVLHHTEGEERRHELAANARDELQAKLDRLSSVESGIVDNLREAEGNVDTLWRLGFRMLANHARSPYAKAFVRWAYAASLCTEHARSGRDFFDLILHNFIDWKETRAALLSESAILRSEEVSTTGKWALARILRATGHPQDARDNKTLVDQLNSAKTPSLGSWRLVEEYCTSDPCDPRSHSPDNISHTCTNYSRIQVGAFHPEKRTQEHLFFDMARPAMARFAPQIGASKHQVFADVVIAGSDLWYRSLIFHLHPHNALLSDYHIAGLKYNKLITNPDGSSFVGDERWFPIQSLLLLSFPFLSASDQLDMLTHVDMEPMLTLLDNLKPLDSHIFRDRLRSACESTNESAQFALLLMAVETPVSVDLPSRTLLAALHRSSSARVRAQAFGLIDRLDDRELIAEIARNEWTARGVTRFDESHYGARLLVSAAQNGIISYDAALSRIHPRDYGHAAGIWKTPDRVYHITSRLDASFRRAAEITDTLAPPAIELHVGHRERTAPTVTPELDRLSSEDRPLDSEGVQDKLAQIQREQISFIDQLRQRGCDFLVDHIDLEEFRYIVEADVVSTDRWYEMLVGLPEERLRIFHNVALLLGYALSVSDPTKSAVLFARVMDQDPLIPVRYGCSRVSLDSLAMWDGPTTEILNEIRFRRLDTASNDYLLSNETLAAHLKGKQDVLRQYVESKLTREEPTATARALMVVGFSDRSTFDEGILSDHKEADGFVSSVCKAASYAFDRNVWARHWFGEMCHTSDVLEFWRYSVLFLKVVDGRYDSWCSEYADRNDPMCRFFPNLHDSLNNRVNKWRGRREFKLYGGDRPEPVYLLSFGKNPKQ